jgi:hypothetical protein
MAGINITHIAAMNLRDLNDEQSAGRRVTAEMAKVFAAIIHHSCALARIQRRQKSADESATKAVSLTSRIDDLQTQLHKAQSELKVVENDRITLLRTANQEEEAAHAKLEAAITKTDNAKFKRDNLHRMNQVRLTLLATMFDGCSSLTRNCGTCWRDTPHHMAYVPVLHP